MNHKLFLIRELEDAAAQYAKPGDVIELGGERCTVCAQERGEDRRWSRTNATIVRDSESRHWAIPWEQGRGSDYAGERGFRPHATDHGNPIHVSAWEVQPKPVHTIIWEVIK